ncbi:hypothetical protein MP638_001141, partial [Amoeboaphelidium occidentale]
MSYLAWQANERADKPEFPLFLDKFLAKNDDLRAVVLAALLTARVKLFSISYASEGTAGAKYIMSYLAWQANERVDKPEFPLFLDKFLAKNDDLRAVVLAALVTARVELFSISYASEYSLSKDYIKENWYKYVRLLFHVLSYFNEHSIADAQGRLFERRCGRGLRRFTLAPLTKMRNEFILVDTTSLRNFGFCLRSWKKPSSKVIISKEGYYSKESDNVMKPRKTDGVSARVHFKKNCYTTDVGKDGFKTFGDKEYVQLDVENKRVVGLDPGRKDMFCCHDGSKKADKPEFPLFLDKFLAKNDDLRAVVLAALLTARVKLFSISYASEYSLSKDYIKENLYKYFPLLFHVLSYFNEHSIADSQDRLLERRRGRGLRTFILAPLTKMRNEFILTDGVSARVHFKKTCYTTDVGKDGFKTFGDKEYVQLNVENKRVVGLDPGRKDIFSCFDGTKAWRQLRRKTDIRRQKAYDVLCKRIAGEKLDSIVAYGSAKFSASSRGSPPIPTTHLYKKLLEKKVCVRLVWEHRTSVVCSVCHNDLPKGKKWRVKICPICKIYWNRDVNAASNIRQIFLFMNGNNGQRPMQFRTFKER